MHGNVTRKHKIMENLLKAGMENIKQPSTWEKGRECTVTKFCKLLLSYKYEGKALCERSWQRDSPEERQIGQLKLSYC